MKRILFYGMLIFAVSAEAQSSAYVAPVATGASPQGGRIMDMNVTSRAIDVSKFNGIAGTPFLSKEYQQAFVRTKNGGQFGNVWVKFNTYGNELLLENSGQLVALADLDSAAYKDKEAGADVQNVILKTGYPAIDNKTAETIYQVLARRNAVQLLKYYQTKIENVKTMGMPDKKTFVTTPVYYIYKAANNSMQKIKLNKSLLSALSDFPNAKELAGKANLRNENEVIQLINSL